MPELPEVETIRLGLEKYLVGHRIKSVEVRFAKIITGDVKNIIGVKFIAVERFGKGLVIHLDNGYAIAIHIKLTGQLIYQKESPIRRAQGKQVSKAKVGTLPGKHTHVIFKLKSQNSKGKGEDAYLYYNDFRRFGWIKIAKVDEVGRLPFFKELGPEFPVIPLSSRAPKGRGDLPRHPEVESREDLSKIATSSRQGRTPRNDKVLTIDKFKEILLKSASPVKTVIMDQKKIGGIGNIYANDGLNLAKINPKRPAKSLSEGEIKKLYEALLEVLKRGLKYGGASELSYVNALGEEGDYQKHFLAYGREGEKCFNCAGIIEKIILSGRGTYFCKKCQR